MKHERLEAAPRVECLDADGLARLDPAEWDDLSANALVENPFYSHEVILAGLKTIDSATPLEALAIRGSEGLLLGLFPFRRRRLPFETADAACNLYQHSCTPLIRREHALPVLGAWLDAVRNAADLPRFWCFRHMHLDSRFVELLEVSLTGRSLRSVALSLYRRPHLTRLESGIDSHIQQVLPKRRLKDIQRNMRRLRELGSLRFERARDAALVERRLEQFLKLEKAGWKGARGTAFLSNSKDAAFARAAFAPREDGTRSVTIDSLLLDDRPLALSINIQARDTAFTPKGAYDERYRSYSPGLVLEYLVIKAFYEDSETVDMDAATTEDGHVLQGLWNDWKAMGTVLVGPADWRFGISVAAARCAHALRKCAKGVVGHGRQVFCKAGKHWGKLVRPVPWAIGLAAICAE